MAPTGRRNGLRAADPLRDRPDPAAIQGAEVGSTLSASPKRMERRTIASVL